MPKTGQTGVLILAAIILLMAPLPLFSAEAFLKPQTSIPPQALNKPQALVAIIIDDIGHNRQRAERMIDIPAPITFAIIPETRYAESLARLAYLSGKEVMVHLPMENSLDRPMERLQLTHHLNRTEFESIFDSAVAQVPYATGVNNHMGSTLTQMPTAMVWLMRSIRKHQMYFIDSRTTHKTVALEIAQQENLRTASRDVFLDNERTFFGVDQQFHKLLDVARRQGSAIGIGHPYPTTVEYLTLALPLLEAQGIQLVSVSELLEMRAAATAEQQIATLFTGAGGE